MKKAQMYIVTVIFMIAMISLLQQSLFTYSAVDLSDPPRSTDYFIIENFKLILQDLVSTSNNCEYDKFNSMEYNIENFITFIDVQEPRMGFDFTKLEYQVNCTNWNDPSLPVLEVTFDIAGKNIKSQGNYSFSRTGMLTVPL